MEWYTMDRDGIDNGLILSMSGLSTVFVSVVTFLFSAPFRALKGGQSDGWCRDIGPL